MVFAGHNTNTGSTAEALGTRTTPRNLNLHTCITRDLINYFRTRYKSVFSCVTSQKLARSLKRGHQNGRLFESDSRPR